MSATWRSAIRADRLLHVDRIACDGRGLCMELLPELLVEDPWGYPAGRDGARDTAVPPDLLADAERAVRDCPRLALRLRAG